MLRQESLNVTHVNVTLKSLNRLNVNVIRFPSVGASVILPLCRRNTLTQTRISYNVSAVTQLLVTFVLHTAIYI